MNLAVQWFRRLAWCSASKRGLIGVGWFRVVSMVGVSVVVVRMGSVFFFCSSTTWGVEMLLVFNAVVFGFVPRATWCGVSLGSGVSPGGGVHGEVVRSTRQSGQCPFCVWRGSGMGCRRSMHFFFPGLFCWGVVYVEKWSVACDEAVGVYFVCCAVSGCLYPGVCVCWQGLSVCLSVCLQQAAGSRANHTLITMMEAASLSGRTETERKQGKPSKEENRSITSV